MQSLESHRQYEAQPDFGMLTDMFQLYTTTDAWVTSNFPSAESDMNYPIPSVARQPDTQSAFSSVGASSQLNAPAQVLSQPTFKAANVMAYNQSVSGLSSAQASSGPVESSPILRNNSIVEPPNFHGTQNEFQRADSTIEQTDASFSKKSSKVGRKRKMEEAEPGSERAIYLEKNRQAASKCRNKQKRQQEDLVEQAREVQTRNKCLKAEMDLLQHELRVYMEYAGHHHQCPDSRLAIYLQREADRLASGCTRASTSPHSPTSSMHTPFAPSIECTPEDRASSID
jgi:hypothetical protein